MARWTPEGETRGTTERTGRVDRRGRQAGWTDRVDRRGGQGGQRGQGWISSYMARWTPEGETRGMTERTRGQTGRTDRTDRADRQG